MRFLIVSPKDPDQKIIKRVVALQGDVILTLGYRTKYVKVPQGHLWVSYNFFRQYFDQYLKVH